MDWEITPYTSGLVLTTILSLITAAHAWRHRRRPGGTTLALAMLAVAEWSVSYIFEANAVTLPLKILWSKIAYVGTVSCVPLWFHVCFTFAEPGRRIRPAAIAALWIIPAGTLALALTNETHHLIWPSFEFADPSHHILIYGHGPAWWVHLVYANLVLIAASVLLIRAAWRFQAIYRLQSLLMLASVTPPWITNALYAFAPRLIGMRDWTPVGMAVAGALLTTSFTKLQFLDLIPVAREQVLASIQDPVFVVDRLGRIIDANPAATALIGIANPIGVDSLNLLATLRDQLVDATGRPLADIKRWSDARPHGEVTMQGKGTFEWHIHPLKGTAGQESGHLILLHDITARAAAEQALRALNRTLEEKVADRTAALLAEQQRRSAILDSVSDGVLMTDRDQIVRYVNRAFSAMTGYKPQAVLGKPLAAVGGGALSDLLNATGPTAGLQPREVQITQANGRTLDVAVAVSPMSTADGEMEGFVCTIRDITREKALERTRKGLIDNISHQLRTPLTNMKLYAYLMAQSDLSDSDKKRLQAIREQIDIMIRLMEDVLDIASLDSRETMAMAMPEPIHPSTLLNDLHARFERTAQEKGIRLSVDPVPPHLPTVLGDQAELVRAISEIVENAVHFTPPAGNVTLRLAWAEDHAGQWVTLSIQDTGPGIPLDEQPYIFKRFFRGRITDTDQTPGTGLGLSIAESIIRMHGGHITVESSPQGTTFTVWLPVSEAPTG